MRRRFLQYGPNFRRASEHSRGVSSDPKAAHSIPGRAPGLTQKKIISNPSLRRSNSQDFLTERLNAAILSQADARHASIHRAKNFTRNVPSSTSPRRGVKLSSQPLKRTRSFHALHQPARSYQSHQFINQGLARALADGATKEGWLAVEGPFLVEEALGAAPLVKTHSVLVAGGAAEKFSALLDRLPADAEVTQVPDRLFASVAQTQLPQGIAALVELPAYNL